MQSELTCRMQFYVRTSTEQMRLSASQLAGRSQISDTLSKHFSTCRYAVIVRLRQVLKRGEPLQCMNACRHTWQQSALTTGSSV